MNKVSNSEGQTNGTVGGSGTPASPQVMSKYKDAARVVNEVLRELIKECVDGANVYQLCRMGDENINKALKSQPEASKTKSGIAFPTCISTNNCACHYSPKEHDPSQAGAILKSGDVVKIELGVHVDGFPVLVAHSLLVAGSTDSDALKNAAILLASAHTATKVALHSMQKGFTNVDTAKAMQRAIDLQSDGSVKAIEGTISFQLAQNALGTGKHIVLNPTESQKRDVIKSDYEPYEVYAVDVSVSSGTGVIKPGSGDVRTTIYRRTGSTHALKLKASRAVLSEISSSFGSMAFHVLHLKDEKKGRFGLVECVNHQLVQPFEPLYEKSTEKVARFMFTAIITPSGPLILTDLPSLDQILAGQTHLLPKDKIQLSDPELDSILSKPVQF
jgi:curved DNA binding protein